MGKEPSITELGALDQDVAASRECVPTSRPGAAAAAAETEWAQMEQELECREEVLKAHARRQTALFNLSAQLASTLDEAEVCQEVVHGLRDTLGYDHLGLFLVDQVTGERVLRASAGWPDAPSEWRIPPGQGLSERPLIDGRLHYTPDVTRDPRYIPGIDGGCELDVPLRIGEEVIGVLVVESRQAHAFDQADFGVLTAVANQISIALHRAREHQALKEAEARYRSLFDGVPVGLYRSAPTGEFLDVNHALVQMLGYPDREALMAINASYLYVDPEERRRWCARLEREGTVRDFKAQFRRCDGTAIWARDTARVVRDAGGRVLYLEGSMQDITQRRRAEEALRQRHRELTTLYEAATAINSDLSLVTVLRTVAEQMARALGSSGCALSIWHAERGVVETLADYNTAAPEQIDPPGTTYALDDYPAMRRTLETGQPILILQDDPRADVEETALMQEQGIKSLLMLPLVARDRVCGLVELIDNLTARDYTADEIHLAESLAAQAALAIENARLHEAVQQELAERVQAEQTLAKERNLLRTLVDNLPDCHIFVKDTQSRFIITNASHLQTLGAETLDEVRGKTDFDLFPRELADQYYADEQAVVQSGLPLLNRVELVINQAGERKWYLTTKVPLRDGNDTVVGLVGMSRDITERVRAEEEIRGLARFPGENPNAVLRVAKSGSLLYANEASSPILRAWGCQINQPLPDDWLKFSLEVLASGSGKTAEFECEGHILSLIFAPIVEAGYVNVYGLDVTELKRAESQRDATLRALQEHSQHLEEMVEERTKELRDAQEQLVRREKLAVLGQLAGGLGHELRTPLGAIKNAAYFLNMVVEESEPEVREMLQILEKEVSNSERIISSLLDFARTKPPTRREVDVNELLRDAYSRTAIPDNIQVVSQLDGGLPAIPADPDQLGQVFGNLIRNAIQAMPEGGQLFVSSRGEPGRHLDWVLVSVTDTGVGIPEENLSKLFEPLFTTKTKGIGLGLALVKTLVEGHGGTIQVESPAPGLVPKHNPGPDGPEDGRISQVEGEAERPGASAVGQGSTFTIRLPTRRNGEV